MAHKKRNHTHHQDDIQTQTFTFPLFPSSKHHQDCYIFSSKFLQSKGYQSGSILPVTVDAVFHMMVSYMALHPEPPQIFVRGKLDWNEKNPKNVAILRIAKSFCLVKKLRSKHPGFTFSEQVLQIHLERIWKFTSPFTGLLSGPWINSFYWGWSLIPTFEGWNTYINGVKPGSLNRWAW